MRKISVILGIVAISGLSGCLETNAERGLAGAAGGALVANALGGSAVSGAVVGGAASYFCRDLNVPGCI